MSLASCREIDDKRLLMKISLDIRKDTLLRSYAAVQYKYAVHHNNEKYAKWEFVPKRTTPGYYANRILSLPRDQIQQLTGMFLQYF